MSIEHGVDGAAGRNFNFTGKATQQTFADLACAPIGLLSFELENGGVHLLGQLSRNATAAANGRSELPDRILCSGRRSCNRSSARSRTLDTARPFSPRPASAPQNEHVHPSPNTPSKASLPP